MEIWGWFLAIFIGMWLVQFLMTKVQMKNYQETLNKMSDRSSGFLGVGVQKQKLGVGVITILVTNDNGEIVECQMMSGVTVFSRFKPVTKFNGQQLDDYKNELKDEPTDRAMKMAIDKIQDQMNLKENKNE